MLNKVVYLVGCLSWLALVACSSGTVDPNANPLAYGEESSSSMSSAFVYSSSSLEEPQHDVSVSKNVVVVVRCDDEDTVYVKAYTIGFNSKATELNYIPVGAEKGGVLASTDGKIAVYGEEKGATASCEVDGKSYLTKFKFGQDGRVERSIKLENYGNVCESLFEEFKETCLLQNADNQFSGACDDDGTLEAYCSYIDGNAIFEAYLDDFTAESIKNCGDNGAHIDSFGI